MRREKAEAEKTVRLKVPMCWAGADCSVVVMKRGNARGTKGAGHRRWDRVNRQREESDDQWRAAALVRWHEPYESRGSRTVLAAPGGESPPGDSPVITGLIRRSKPH